MGLPEDLNVPQIKPESFGHRFMRKLRTIVIAGLVVTVPIGLTVWIIAWLFEKIDALLQPIITAIFGEPIIGVGFGVIVVLVLIVGAITTNVVGKRMIRWAESQLARVPFTRTLYVGIKQIVQSFSEPKKTGFMQVVLIEFPVKGMKTIAFITNEEHDRSGRKFYNVFIPTAFNPTGGFLEIVREEDMVRTNLTVEEALKMAVSGGRLSPPGLIESLVHTIDNSKQQEQNEKPTTRD